MAEVVNIHEALRLDHARVHKATDQLVKASVRFDGFQDMDTGERTVGVRQQWQEAFDDALIAMEEQYLKREQRLPAADVRNARITKQIRDENPELYGEYLALESTVKTLQQTITNRKAAISAAQSVLRGERD